jgi:hypothetical protein
MGEEAICFCRELQYARHNFTDFARLAFELAPQIAEARCLTLQESFFFLVRKSCVSNIPHALVYPIICSALSKAIVYS